MFFSLSIASAVRKPLRVEKAQGFGHEADVQRVGIKRLAVDVHDAFAVAADVSAVQRSWRMSAG